MMKLSVTANSEYKKMYYCCSSSCLSLFFYAEAVLAEPHMGLMRDKIPNYRLWSNCLKGYYNYYDSSTSTKREHLFPFLMLTQCLKITEKVSFNIASEASGQKLIKNAGNGPFWRVFENLKLAVKQCYQTGQF